MSVVGYGGGDWVKKVWTLLTLFIMAGCTAIEKSPYPPEWPKTIALGSSCKGINGIYQSRAEQQTYSHPQKESLLAITLLPANAKLEGVANVSIGIQEDGALWVRAYDTRDALLSEHVYPVGDGAFSCDTNALVFLPAKKPGTERAPDNPVVGVGWERVAFRKTATDALVMQSASGVTGMAFLIVPVHARSEQWYLFMPVTMPLD